MKTGVIKLTAVAFASIALASCNDQQSSSGTTAQVPSLSNVTTTSTPKEYDISLGYPANSIVSYKGTQYQNGWWSNPGECPLKEDCAEKYADGQWKKYDPTLKHEFVNYDYATLQANYPQLPSCTQAEYSMAYVKNIVDANVSSGEMSQATPSGGFTQRDKDALYSEYMLPCKPDLNLANVSSLPINVQTVMRVMPESVWNQLAGNRVKGDSGSIYFDVTGKEQKWPNQANFVDIAYKSFLTGVARYPYFCGEQGFYNSVEDACKREIASLFAHAAQETGNTKVTDSFYWLREFGYVNGSSYFDTGCAAPFNCPHKFERYYGRGPKQVSYYYNYAGFSAAYFNGNYQYLLSWPDMVAYDPDLYFTSAIWFVMTHQPPKPSIHDVMLGKYKPDTSCTQATCKGVDYSPTTGVKNNFDITIEVVNGGPECRGDNVVQSTNRTNGFKQVLGMLGATMSAVENSLPLGCDFIANHGAIKGVSVFADPKLEQGVHTWIDLSGSSCQAQSGGGAAMISITSTGIVTACKNKK